MCGRSYTKRQKQEIAARMRAKKTLSEPFAPDPQHCPHTSRPMIRLDRENDEREMLLARCGLSPFFARAS